MKIPLLVILALLPLKVMSQTLFGTANGTLSDTQNRFEFSIGEPIVAEISGEGFLYNIGFNQPYWDFFTPVSSPKLLNYFITPNPFTDSFHFATNSEIEHFFLIDASGREVFRTITTGSNFDFKSPCLPKGFYLLKVQLENGMTVSSKLIHQ
jgi:hypothetical protein